MERLSAKSFIDNGHEYHLYSYNEISNIPEGVIVKDGRDILPEEDIFAYKVGPGKGSFSAFSNYFRYKLLELKGGWWVDTDMVCVKPWDMDRKYVFISEQDYYTRNDIINSGAIKCPVDSEVMKYCYGVCESKNKETLEWGIVGPKLLGEGVEKFDLQKYVYPRQTFCVVAPFNSQIFIKPISSFELPDGIYGIHLWNEVWRRYNLNKHIKHDPSCIYERLKTKHGIE